MFHKISTFTSYLFSVKHLKINLGVLILLASFGGFLVSSGSTAFAEYSCGTYSAGDFGSDCTATSTGSGSGSTSSSSTSSSSTSSSSKKSTTTTSSGSSSTPTGGDTATTTPSSDSTTTTPATNDDTSDGSGSSSGYSAPTVVTPIASSTSSKSGIDWRLIISIIVGLVIIGVGIWIIVATKRRNNSGSNTPPFNPYA